MTEQKQFKFPGFPPELERATWNFPTILNGYVAQLTGAEFKVLWYIVRHTFGWQKSEDTISYKQFKEGIIKKDGTILDKGTGLSTRSLRRAIQCLVEKGFIEVEKTRWKGRQGINKYKVKTRVPKVKTDSRQKENQTECQKEKETIVTYKQSITKTIIPAEQSSAGQEINLLIEKFKSVNPTYERLFGNTTQRAAMERLVKKFGKEKVENMIAYLPKTNQEQFAPVIISPLQLEQKLGQLIAFLKKGRSEKINIIA